MAIRVPGATGGEKVRSTPSIEARLPFFLLESGDLDPNFMVAIVALD